MKAEFAVIGGSGLYSMAALEEPKTITVLTPYGKSPEIIVGAMSGRGVAFLPRHGKSHTIPPHLINYRANIWALKKLGVARVIGTTASGSLNPKMRPGDLATLTQFLDLTKCRSQTFYEGGKSGVLHVDVSQPYCPDLNKVLAKSAKSLGIRLHHEAIYVCTEGPRFETAAEISAYRKLGADLVGMTSVPECVLARELEMCYAGIGIVTNLGAGILSTKLSHAKVLELMKANIRKVQDIILVAIPKITKERPCSCSTALEGAVL